MNALDLFTLTYGKLYNYGNLPVCIMSPLRRIVRKLANWYLPIYLSKPNKRKGIVEKGLIVSLTSFPARIHDVWKVIESIKNQTILPEKIILWLFKEQFLADDSIPIELKKKDDLFEIRLVNENIRSHTKYYYTLKEYPDYTIITCDDDIYYDPYMIERLLSTSKKFPNCIIANKTTQILFDENGNAKPYIEWTDNVPANCSEDLLQLGVCGVLYPPYCLHELVLRKDLFWELSPLADDIWLNAMARLNGTPIVQCERKKLVLPIESNSPSLTSVNNGESMNDKQILRIRDYLVNNNFVDVYSSKCHVVASK